MLQNAGTVGVRAKRVVDAAGDISLGAEPLQHGGIVGLVACGKSSRVEINDQSVMLLCVVGGKVKVEFVAFTVSVRNVGKDGSHGIVPFDGILAVRGVIGNFADNAYQREQYENADTQQNEQPRMLCFCFNAHRKTPPNKVPPSSRFKVARTASLPNTVPQSASTARMMSRFGVNMMIAPFRMKKIRLT